MCTQFLGGEEGEVLTACWSRRRWKGGGGGMQCCPPSLYRDDSDKCLVDHSHFGPKLLV